MYAEKTPSLPRSGAIGSAPVHVCAEIREGQNSHMGCKTSSLRGASNLTMDYYPLYLFI